MTEFETITFLLHRSYKTSKQFKKEQERKKKKEQRMFGTKVKDLSYVLAILKYYKVIAC